jgi:uncharacterized glyoxalase superfamily protein PhnB
MSSLAKDTKATVLPPIRYSDEPAAIEWLCRAFGSQKHLVVPNDDGTISEAAVRCSVRSRPQSTKRPQHAPRVILQGYGSYF